MPPKKEDDLSTEFSNADSTFGKQIGSPSTDNAIFEFKLYKLALGGAIACCKDATAEKSPAIPAAGSR